MIGFLIALFFLTRRFNENFFIWLDLSILTLTPVLFFHHLGTFFAGSEYGTQTALPWGVTFTNPEAVGYSTLPIHPTQIYAAIIVLGLFIAASFIFKTTARSGKTGAFLLLTLSLAYFSLEFLRGDSAPTLGLLRIDQYFTLAFAVLAVGFVIKIKYTAREARVGEIHLHSQNHE